MFTNREAFPRFAPRMQRGTSSLASLALAMACSAGEGADPVPTYSGPPGFTGDGAGGAQQGSAGSNPGANAGGADPNAVDSEGNGQQSGLPVGAQGGSSSGSAGPGPQNPGVSGAGGQPAGSGDPSNPGGSAGQPQEPSSPPPANPDCADLFFCDGFETAAVGGSPEPSLWSLVVGYNYTVTQSPDVVVSTGNARSGSRSVRVESQTDLTGIIATVPEDRFFLRVWLQVDAAPRGPALIGIGTDHNSETRLRVFNDGRAIINTFNPGDAVHPGEASTPSCPGCVSLPANEWFCAEFFIDNAAQNATLWIDGVEAASIVSGEGGWPQQPSAPNVRIGCMSIEGARTGVWIDDVAAGPQRIGCD